ncbi:phosphonoacetaldehyde hydrolase [Patella vulgata]|uniref:phosphonoacetaldehyde hydrolase n=1 Tax=Patella vulgata TaxID=6465 RepID=UPI00217F65B0|nr:phosphonoacetaldehyde hydrolase [Patella vulgata]
MAVALKQLRSQRSYLGKVQACILDWSGTTADKYVLAPAVVFCDVFKKHKVPISMLEARGPMGLRKDLHIKALTEVDSVRQRWLDVYGKYPEKADVDRMFEDFVPMQLACIKQYGALIPGAAEAVNKLRQEYNCKIGMTTGFLRSMVDLLLEEAKKQGFEPDANVAGDEVVHGARPKPYMVYRNMDLLNVHPIQSVVKVDDTVSGVGEAIEAGCWGVGVARYSNYMNVDSLEQAQKLTPEEIETRLAYSRKLLVHSGAHYVIDSIVELPDVVDDINRRLANGEKP